MFRAFLAIYMVLFACVLPALHTCEPVAAHAAGDTTGPKTVAPEEHHHHPERSADDVCVVCRLSGNSGGVLPPPLCMSVVAPQISVCIELEQPVPPPPPALEEILPRAPPA